MGELIQALGRAICQGVDQSHPITGKSNTDWIKEEKIDVENMFKFLRLIVVQGDSAEDAKRADRKFNHIMQWIKSIMPGWPNGA